MAEVPPGLPRLSRSSYRQPGFYRALCRCKLPTNNTTTAKNVRNCAKMQSLPPDCYEVEHLVVSMHRFKVQYVYMKDLGGKDLRRVCRKYNIKTVFTTVDTLRRQLTKVKDTDSTLAKSGVVYRNRETKRNLGTHLREHRAATRQEPRLHV